MTTVDNFIKNLVIGDVEGSGRIGHYPFQLVAVLKNGNTESVSLRGTDADGFYAIFADYINKSNNVCKSIAFPPTGHIDSNFVGIFAYENGVLKVKALPYDRNGERGDLICEGEVLKTLRKDFFKLTNLTPQQIMKQYSDACEKASETSKEFNKALKHKPNELETMKDANEMTKQTIRQTIQSIFDEAINFVLTKYPDARASYMKATEDLPEVWHIIDCAAPGILGFGECEHSAWVNTSKNIRAMAAESKPDFEKIDDLSYSGLTNIIQGCVSIGADVLENLAHENDFLNNEIERLSKVLGSMKCRQESVLCAKDKILSIFKRKAPLTVQRQGYTIEVSETGLYINRNVI